MKKTWEFNNIFHWSETKGTNRVSQFVEPAFSRCVWMNIVWSKKTQKQNKQNIHRTFIATRRAHDPRWSQKKKKNIIYSYVIRAYNTYECYSRTWYAKQVHKGTHKHIAFFSSVYSSLSFFIRYVFSLSLSISVFTSAIIL